MFIWHGFFVDELFFSPCSPPEYSPGKCRPCRQFLENHEAQIASLFSPCITALGFLLTHCFELCSCSPYPCLPVTSIDVFFFKLSALPAHRRGEAVGMKKPPWLPGPGTILMLQEMLNPTRILVAGKDQPYKTIEVIFDADFQLLDMYIPLKI